MFEKCCIITSLDFNITFFFVIQAPCFYDGNIKFTSYFISSKVAPPWVFPGVYLREKKYPGVYLREKTQ